MVKPGFLTNILRQARRARLPPARAEGEGGVASDEAASETAQSLGSFDRTWRWDDDDPYIKRAELSSPGIRESICIVNGDIFDGDFLSVLPEGYTSLHTSLATETIWNSQDQSPFFNLPPEIRNIIYCHLFGNRKVHIDHDFREIGSKGQKTWVGWHHICDDPDSCPEGKNIPCPETANAEKRFVEMGWGSRLRKGFEWKLQVVSWLRCCKLGYNESIPVLYRTNKFVLSHGVDQLFRISRTLPKDHLSMMTSMEIEIPLYRIINIPPPTMDGIFEEYYKSLFDILLRDLPGLRSLSLSFNSIPPHRGSEWSDKDEKSWLRPWEELARSRRWSELSIGVSAHWLEEFRGRKRLREKLDGESEYTLHAAPEAFMKGW